MQKLQVLLDRLVTENRRWTGQGRVAQYIPELGKADGNILGICIGLLKGRGKKKEVKFYSSGDCAEKFTMQSISKPLALMLALKDRGFGIVFSRVGMEPTGDPFNSIIKLETLKPSKPLNPMINAGAIATTSFINGRDTDEKFKRLLRFVRKLAGNEEVYMNERMYLSEKLTGDRNRSLAYFMRDLGVIEGDVEEILDLYFRQCAIEVTCSDLANIAVCIANEGISPFTSEQLVEREIIKVVKTFMVTCGMYNHSGEFAVRVGIPAKSGVSGGIMAAVPGRMGIGVIGPALDDKGNSIAGIHLLEDLSRELDLSIF